MPPHVFAAVGPLMSTVTVKVVLGLLPKARACRRTIVCLPTRSSGDFVDQVNFLVPGLPGFCESPATCVIFGWPSVLSTDLTLHTKPVDALSERAIVKERPSVIGIVLLASPSSM